LKWLYILWWIYFGTNFEVQMSNDKMSKFKF
jgi:hypothetical protein